MEGEPASKMTSWYLIILHQLEYSKCLPVDAHLKSLISSSAYPLSSIDTSLLPIYTNIPLRPSHKLILEPMERKLWLRGREIYKGLEFSPR